jgi:hypothetical protein
MSLTEGAWELRSNRINEAASMTPLSASITYSLPFYVENAIELLDQPGEWCFDRVSQILYYYPKIGEDINSVEVIVPVCDKLIEIKGSSLNAKVNNVSFEDICFSHTSWNAPSNEGWYGYQSEHLVRPAGVVTPPAAIEINNASNFTVRNNVVETAPRWLHIWKSSIHDIILSNNYSNVYAFLNKGTNIAYEDPILSTNTTWSSGVQTIINNSGFDSSYTRLAALLPLVTNIAPSVSVNGSGSKTISIIDQLKLSATVSDDGKPYGLLKTIWRKKSGPGTVTFPTAEQLGTLVFFSAPDTYTLECEASDLNLKTVGTIQVTVTTASLGPNRALNKTAIASSSYDATNYIASKGVDGNVNSDWVP